MRRDVSPKTPSLSGKNPNLGVLGSLETGLMRRFGEAKPRQTGSDDVEARVVSSARGQKGQDLLHFEKVARP